MSGTWSEGWRDSLPELFTRDWDLVIVGGGISGAGILLEAARRGLTALLLEQRDFAWGTSSRSSKLVHGGLRYLKQGKVGLTRDSVRERQALLRDAAGLVEPQGFAFGHYRGRKPGKRQFLAGLAIYDFLAGQRTRHYVDAGEFAMLAPNAARDGLLGGLCYADAKTDDARLVLRVLQEAQTHGGVAVNYMAVRTLLRDAAQQVCGVVVADGQQVRARLVVNATGAWADGLRGQLGAAPKLRPLRGSHLVLPAWRLPLAQAISLMHPVDGRPVFAFPWEGVIVAGTTDVDHGADMQQEAVITRRECDYLMQALRFQFPHAGLADADILSTYAGVRPVIDSGKLDPSKEGRDHALWIEQGLLTVTGGKLTTFRSMALAALKQAAPLLPGWHADLTPQPILRQPAPLNCAAPGAASSLTATQQLRLLGRYGAHAQALVDAARDGELDTIPGTETLWAQLRWGARAEGVMQLDDLLLRRTRLGLQLPGGGRALLPRIRAICQHELAWDDARWQREEAAWLVLWDRCHGLPPGPADDGSRDD